MALRLRPTPALAPLPPERILRTAIDEFEDILSAEQRRDLRRDLTIPDADAVLVFTAELDAQNNGNKCRKIASNVMTFLQFTSSFSSVIDTFVSSNPEIAALIWGSVKFTMSIVVNFSSYYQSAGKLFMDLGKLCPTFEEYRLLYPRSAGLQSALCHFQASIIHCCKHVVEAMQRPWARVLVHAFYRSFEQEFKPDTEQIQRLGKDVKFAIELAKAQADHQDQQLQEIERKEASKGRSRTLQLLRQSHMKLDEQAAKAAQREEQRKEERKQLVLKQLSEHDYLTPLKQARKLRHGNTAQWVFQTSEFCRWANVLGSSLLWCSGKIGAGKTILTASVIDHLLIQKREPDILVAFFFARFDDQQSLQAETILRSIGQQVLRRMNLTPSMQSLLQDIDLESTLKLLQMQASTLRTLYIVIDGLDELDKLERDRLLRSLATLIAQGSNIKIFISGRESLASELTRKLPTHERVPMACDVAQLDITMFIEDTLQEKLAGGELIVRDRELIAEIKKALTDGADGMFLWVKFQIEEICAQHSDADIRNVIKDLPKSLTEVFERVLRRIAGGSHSTIASKAFRWVGAAKRPLCLDELGEAILIEVGQPYSMPDRLCNDIGRIAAWCENLVQVDEEQETIQFAHATIRQHLLEASTEPQLQVLHFDLADANHLVGETCVTYLHFNDFVTTVAKRTRRLPPISPIATAKVSLRHQWNVSSSFSTIEKLLPKRRVNSQSFDITETVTTLSERDYLKPLDKLCVNHPFLPYASVNWIFHTRDFCRGKSRTWDLWKLLVRGSYDHVQNPWKESRLNLDDIYIWQWIVENCHSGLLRVIKPDVVFSEMPWWPNRGEINNLNLDHWLKLASAFVSAASRNQEAQVAWVLSTQCIGIDSNACISALVAASRNGCLEMVELFLRGGVEPNSCITHSRTPLTAAVQARQLDIIEVLVRAGAEINVCDGTGRTPLIIAIEFGTVEVIRLLLSKGADIDMADSVHRRTPLITAVYFKQPKAIDILLREGSKANGYLVMKTRIQEALIVAAHCGYLEGVDFLLEHWGAHVNEPDHLGYTPLSAAARAGHPELVDLLLDMGAHVNKFGRSSFTPLTAAAEAGHLNIINTLLEKGADINYSDGLGWTPLGVAARAGYLDVLDRLLKKGARIGQVSTSGWTPLAVAAKAGKLEILDFLVRMGAHVNIEGANVHGLTPLAAAAEGGHLDAVRFLHEKKASINRANAHGWTPLAAAAGAGHVNVLGYLLEKGAQIDGIDKHSLTPLAAAAKAGHLDTVRFLLVHKASINKANSDGWTPLATAARAGHVQVLDYLLSKGAQIYEDSASNRMPLTAAAEAGQLQAVRFLLGKGARINKVDRCGMTPLAAAAEHGHREVVELLLKERASVETAGEHARLPLDNAAAGGHEEIVILLLRSGADINKAGQYGRTPLKTAAASGHEAVVHLLLSRGADINGTGGDDQTPIQAAEAAGHYGVVDFLFMRGATQ